MNEMSIRYSPENLQEKGEELLVFIEDKPEEELLYKFIVGCDGTWKTIKDFSKDDKVEWTPESEGKYIIMVQAKREDSTKSFDYVSRIDYILGKVQESLITNIYIENTKLEVGDKLLAHVEVSRLPVMFKYWVRENENWHILKDYSSDNNLNWSVKTPGKKELLVECKTLDSQNDFDDFKKISFEVADIKKLEIKNFKCITEDIVVSSELIFEVESSYEEGRMILYKFMKIDKDGTQTLVQDYSTKKMVNLIEKKSGDYKLLCYTKDMYSLKQYDDRALINYSVKPYKKIQLHKITTDLSSSQIVGTTVNIKAVASGGKDLVYRFIIDGNYGDDSGYIRSNNYMWKTKKEGKYKIDVWIKDISFDGNYEVKGSTDFVVDEKSEEPVCIKDVIFDKNRFLVKNETLNAKVIATGGSGLRYSFIVKNKNTVLEKVGYGTCNWVNFTPEKSGNYELEVRVKDKYSKREYDVHSLHYVEVFDYLPAIIDYILIPIKACYLPGEQLDINIITQNTKNTLVKYVLRIDGHKVEETEFTKNKKYIFLPRHSGIYNIEVFAKNILSDKAFDSKKELKIIVQEALPTNNTKIQCDSTEFSCNEVINFTATSEGGKDVLYEFYLMEKGEWNLVQKYSKKDYYTFMPFSSGKYKILVLTKSSYKKCAYEDHDMFVFEVRDNGGNLKR